MRLHVGSLLNYRLKEGKNAEKDTNYLVTTHQWENGEKLMRWQLRIVLTFVPVLESGCLRPNHYTTVKAILLKNCQNVTKIKTVVMFTSVVQVSSVCMCFQTIKQFETLFLIEYIFLITSFVLLFSSLFLHEWRAVEHKVLQQQRNTFPKLSSSNHKMISN